MITKPWSIITNVCVAKRKIICFARNIASWKNTRKPQKLSRKVRRKPHFIGPRFKFKGFKLEQQIHRRIQKNSLRVASQEVRVDSGTSIEYRHTFEPSPPSVSRLSQKDRKRYFWSQSASRLESSASRLLSRGRSASRLFTITGRLSQTKTENVFSVDENARRHLNHVSRLQWKVDW